MANIKLKNLYICENVIIAFNGQPSLINLTSEITSNAFPAIHPKLTILVSTFGQDGKFTEEIDIISNEDEKVIGSVKGVAEIKDGGVNSFIANFINTVFPKEGKYWIKISVDGHVLTKKDENFILVKKSI